MCLRNKSKKDNNFNELKAAVELLKNSINGGLNKNHTNKVINNEKSIPKATQFIHIVGTVKDEIITDA